MIIGGSVIYSGGSPVRRSFFVPLVSRYRQLDQALDLEALNLEFARWLAITGNRTMVITGRFEADTDRSLQSNQVYNQAIVINSVIGNDHSISLPARRLNQNIVPVFGNIDRYQSSLL